MEMKRKMKSIVALILCCAIGISVVGCSSEDNSSSESDSSAVSSSDDVSSESDKETESKDESSEDETDTYKNDVTAENQTLGLEGVENARQIGGYYTTDGKKVKDGVLLRSAKLAAATEEDLTKLKETYNLTTVIDFRTTDEIAAAPDPEIDGVENVQIRILDESVEDDTMAVIAGIYAETDDPALAMLEMYRKGILSDDMYTKMFESDYTKKAYRKFFDQLLAQEDGAVLWHCTGGKDRAGTAAVLMLTVLGVDKETVLADFALTNDFNKASIDYMVSAASELTDDQEELDGVAALVGVLPKLMENLFDKAEAEDGSMLEFIKKNLDITDEEIEKLRGMYLE